MYPTITSAAVDGSPSTVFAASERRHNLVNNNNSSPEPRFLNAHLLRKLLPDTKFVVMLRNPVNRCAIIVTSCMYTRVIRRKVLVCSSHRLFSDFLHFETSSRDVTTFHERTVIALRKLRHCFEMTSERKCVYFENNSNTRSKHVS